MKKKFNSVVGALLQLVLGLSLTTVFAPRLSAQTAYGSVAGTVSDVSGGAIADAQVTLTNLGTAEKRIQQSGTDGLYSFVNLLPGRYRIDVEKTGFKRVTRPEVIVEVGQVVRIDLPLQIGEVTQTAEVTGETPQLQSETSSLGQVVEERKANELPLNGRNVFNLVSLAPSVVPQGSAGGTPVGVNPFGWGNYQVNGSFGNESAEYLDGQPLNIGYINLPVVIPTQDSIQEFKVQTSNLGADWGKFSGGVTNLSTKAGTSSLHGEAYEYLRNKIFNANDFFLKSVGRARPPWVQNQFGANAGGPLNFSRLGGRNKTFWFVSGEGFRLRTREPFTATVPDAQERAGNFSEICKSGFTAGVCNDRGVDASGKPVVIDQIYDPCGGIVNAQGTCPGSVTTPTPFPNNILPADRINRTSAKLLNLWPDPNTPNATTNNFTTAAATGGNHNQVVARIDHNVTNKQRLFVRYSYWNVLDLPVDPL